jgi:hypothetical protein
MTNSARAVAAVSDDGTEDRSWSLQARWAALSGPADPGRHDLWSRLSAVYDACDGLWPESVAERVAALLDAVDVPTTPAAWDAIGALLAQVDAIIAANRVVEDTADSDHGCCG